jgi:hypothetical protein
MFSFCEKAITLYYFLLNKKSMQGLDYLFKKHLLKKSMKNTFLQKFVLMVFQNSGNRVLLR